MSFVCPLLWILSLSSATSLSSSKMCGFGPSGILKKAQFLPVQPSVYVNVTLNLVQLYQLYLPVIEEEAVLKKYVEDKIDKPLSCHTEQVLSNEVPAEGVGAVILTLEQKTPHALASIWHEQRLNVC